MGLLDELKKALAERILNTEMEVHLDRQSEQAEGRSRLIVACGGRPALVVADVHANSQLSSRGSLSRNAA